jgi:phenylacetate-CoA ligase
MGRTSNRHKCIDCRVDDLMPDLQSIYHKLPAPLRGLVASSYGYYLRWWRYDLRTAKLIAEARERESWSEEEWQSWQEERLSFILHRAATKVPYYREQWAARRRNNDRASWEYLENWPILKKETLRSNPQALVADDCNIRRMYADHTSGSSGTPVTIWLSRDTVKKWYALYKARTQTWYGVSQNDHWAMLGSQLVTPASQTQPPFWVWNAGLKQLYLSSYHLSPSFIPAYLEAIRRYRVTYMLGLASSMQALAHFALQEKQEMPKLKVAINNGEPLFPHRRQVISRAFGCPVRDTYGMVEIVCAASECNEGVMHLWPETGILEIFSDQADEKALPGENGRFIATGLLNSDMPLIRYSVGDRGSISPNPGNCSCGRHLPILNSLVGRIDDVVWTPDGRRVGCVDAIFKADLPVIEAQIIQESLEQIRIRYVPAPNYNQNDEDSIRKGLRQRIGDIEVIFEPVDAIERNSNGKFKVIITKIRDLDLYSYN